MKLKNIFNFRNIQKNKSLIFLGLLILSLITYFYIKTQISESFISGAEVQLLTSKPYYT